MRKYIYLLIAVSVAGKAFAQDNTLKLKNLALPSSPAFTLTDITPTLIQNPTTPKAFILGIGQAYQQSGTGFPNNYSLEFAPYWWLKPKGRSVYSFLGFKTHKDAANKTVVDGEDAFAGLKFTSVSAAFIEKDLIPDTSSANQKVFSIGLRTTIIKVHLGGYTDKLAKAIDKWHTSVQAELAANDQVQAEIARHPERQDEILANYKNSPATDALLANINDIITEKPIFSWDVAGAYATYGINDEKWTTGRTGVWTTLSSYIPLNLDGSASTDAASKNYLNLNFMLRYLSDNYQKNEDGTIGKNNNLDIGFKGALEFDKFSIGAEYLNRYIKGVSQTQNRLVGVINYKLSDNIFLTGTYGKNFTVPNKLISSLGINWGIGSEKVNLPDK